MIESIDYETFDLRITKTGDSYHIRVLGSPVGATDSSPGPRLASILALHWPQDREQAQEIGTRLFEAVFHGSILTIWQRSLDAVTRNGTGLRIRLRLADDAPELATCPWEFLYDPDAGRFLCQSTQTPLVRYLHLAQPEPPLAVSGALNILVVAASPQDRPSLQLDAEVAAVTEALSELIASGRVVMERLPRPTVRSLLHHLRCHQVHVLYFLGHGEFDPKSHQGRLILQDNDRNSHPIDGQMLGELLHDERSLRLVVLNACNGGYATRDHLYAGVAQRLVQQGIPAVLAMQSAVADQVSIDLIAEFYTALADGYPVDAALTEGRRLVAALGHGVEWGIPVLYMRAPDGYIFNVRDMKTIQLSGPGSRGASLTQTRLLQRVKEAQSSLEMLNKRIAALKSDMARELDGERRVTLQARLLEVEQQRSEIEQELARWRQQLAG